jgi:hypothetical protein
MLTTSSDGKASLYSLTLITKTQSDDDDDDEF